MKPNQFGPVQSNAGGFQSLENHRRSFSSLWKVPLIALSLICSATCIRAAEVARSDIIAALNRVGANLEKVNGSNFKVEIHCPEVDSLLALQMAAMPIPMKAHLELSNLSGNRRVKMYVDGAPPAMAALLEQKARERFRFLFTAAERASTWAIFFKAIPDSAQIDVIKADDRILEFEINGVNEPFQGKVARSVRVRVNRTNDTFESLSGNLSDGGTMALSWQSREMDVPTTRGKVWMPVSYEISARDIKDSHVTGSEKYTAVFDNFHFFTEAEVAALTSPVASKPEDAKSDVKKIP